MWSVPNEVIYLEPDSLGTAGWTLGFSGELLWILTVTPGVNIEGPAEDCGLLGPAEKGEEERETEPQKSFCYLYCILVRRKNSVSQSYSAESWLEEGSMAA